MISNNEFKMDIVFIVVFGILIEFRFIEKGLIVFFWIGL